MIILCLIIQLLPSDLLLVVIHFDNPATQLEANDSVVEQVKSNSYLISIFNLSESEAETSGNIKTN